MKKESLFAAIDQRQAEILSWGNAFFDCAELGFQEVKTAAAITALLDQWNIPYESGIAMTGIRVTPVSYTHLDVYKRQDSREALPHTPQAFKKA